MLTSLRPRTLLACLGLVAAALAAGCGSESVPASSSQAATTPTVTGEFGKSATIALPGPTPTGFSVTVLTEGKGRAVAKGDLLTAHYLGETWRDGKVFDESYKRGAPASFPIGVGRVIPGWDEGLVGKKIGSRVLLVLPPAKGYGERGQPRAGIQPTDTLVFVVDIVQSIGSTTSADGTPVAPKAGLPVVTAKPGQKPVIVIPKGVPAPTKLVVQHLLQGGGPAVKSGQTVTVQYVGVVYATGKQFDASWDGGQPLSTSIGTGSVITGWDKGLVGVKTGSRVMLLIPPSDGYGSAGQPSAGIGGTDTLVFVIDVLAAN